MNCSQCGNPIRDGIKFCGVCGKNVLPGSEEGLKSKIKAGHGKNHKFKKIIVAGAAVAVVGFLTFCGYKTFIQPAAFIVRSNIGNVAVYDGKTKIAEVKSSNQYSRISVAPGRHTLVAEYKIGEVTHTVKQEVEGNGWSKLKSITLKFDCTEIDVPSDYKNADVYINGHETNEKVSQLNDKIALFGDDYLELENSYPWGKMMSDKITPDNTDITFPIDQQTQDGIENTIINYEKSYIDAHKAVDSGKLVNCSDSVRQGAEQSIKNDANCGQTITCSFDGMVFYTDTFAFSDENSIQVIAVAKSTYKATLPGCSTAAPSSDQSMFTLSYDRSASQWVIQNIAGNWDMGLHTEKKIEVHYGQI